ncbi:signal peptide peptidase SppA [Flavobacterium sp. WLB]|uniref:signal peptide peptidase SppA n=1 Tax=unclassified Flavobacterium TaxID=196869 RepID=UPI0006ABD9CF|nr:MULTISPECIES: signal peptide peptidase SppA [unclassified Flavobacterium]KOP38571.1 protease IV [Flavobacterium sp. VMW]OWU89865.1 signal peptide peptidase SppA [Flavobacterium sp. NLM]PUU71861.1 signal peptide peptidase SppA [Flavobacterium sp. WLB]
MKFLGNVIATVIGIFVFIMLFFFGVILIGAIFGGDDKVSVKNDSVIELDLKQINNDYAGKYKDPWVTVFSDKKSVGLTDVINAIEAAETDDNIKGISILNDESSLGLAQYKDLRNALENFKKSGKFVWAYANTYSQKEYYLNSVANVVYLNPAGDLDFKGLSSEVMFFKDFQEKSGIHMEVIRHGKYKSAVEPFLENKMSDANREQVTALLNSIWSTVCSDISKSRNIPVDKLNEIANGLLARTPQMAKTQHLVDIVAYEDVYHNAIKKALKVKDDEDYNKISILDYTQNNVTTALTNVATDQIAIIYAQGEIAGGEGDVNVIGEGSMRRSLQEARKNEDVKAIVLRIDSPGGSALTSDLIWREIEVTKKVKPVIVSMGNYAASGGYYIACNANKIFAESNTITGSIGVFGVLPNFTPLANKLGINTEQVKTHENSANYSPFVPVDEKFKAFTLEGVEQIYKTFVTHVAEGRKMTFAQVDSIAQGRVWSGSEALKIGLVDKIGGLNDAIAEAAKIAKIKDYGTQNYPEYEKTFGDLMGNLPFAQSKEAFIKEEIGEENYLLIEQVKRFQRQKGVQAMMPFGINIK